MRRLTVTKRKYAVVNDKDLYDRLKEQGFNIFAWQDGPGAIYSPHSHGHDEIIVISSGSMVFSVGGAEHLLESGDELVLPAHTVHAAENRSAEPVHYFICSD